MAAIASSSLVVAQENYQKLTDCEQDEKTSKGTGELRAAYESESDEYSGSDADDVNDEFDDTARPGQSATQYGWL